jgi:hypothetical protein
VVEVRNTRPEKASPAIQAAGRWARSFLISRRGFAAAVREAVPEQVELVRVRWRGRSRRIIVRYAVTESRVRNVEEPLDPGKLNPWVESRETLAAIPHQISRCRFCDGAKKVRCLTCQGTAIVQCEACNGSGSIWSQRSGRMIACRTCRGNSMRRCSCRDGFVSCGPCAGKGKVEEWLEITEEPFDRVLCKGSDVLAQMLTGCAHPEQFDTDSLNLPIPLLTSWRGRMIGEAPAELQSVLRRPDLTGFNPREDRLEEVSLQIFRSEATTVAYQFGGVSGSVRVQGWDGRALENDSSRKPFQQRWRRVWQGMLGGFLAGATLAIWYGARHSFFRMTTNYDLLWRLALILSVCIIPLVLWWLLPAERREWRSGLKAGLPALLVTLAQAVLAATGGPSLEHARTLASRGRMEEALRESNACFDLGREAESAGAFHDQLQLGKVRQAREPRQAWEAASLPFLTAAGREQARAHAVDVTAQASAALQEKGEFTESATVLDLAPAEIRKIGPLGSLRRRVYFEEAQPLWKIIETRRKSLEDRVAACNDISPFVQGLASLPARPDEDASLMPEEIEAKCQDLRAQRLKQIEREREAEARAAERARRREEATRKAAWRRWAYAPLLCNDGTRSPSCICGSSSHRGCCSWHGGVAGCSAEYPE